MHLPRSLSEALLSEATSCSYQDDISYRYVRSNAYDRNIMQNAVQFNIPTCETYSKCMDTFIASIEYQVDKFRSGLLLKVRDDIDRFRRGEIDLGDLENIINKKAGCYTWDDVRRNISLIGPALRHTIEVNPFEINCFM